MNRISTRALVVVGVLVALFLAGFASISASSDPDGLTKVSQDQGFAQSAKQHRAGDSPFARYQTRDLGEGRLSGVVAGVVGSLVVLIIVGGGVLVVRRPRTPDGS